MASNETVKPTIEAKLDTILILIKLLNARMQNLEKKYDNFATNFKKIRVNFNYNASFLMPSELLDNQVEKHL